MMILTGAAGFIGSCVLAGLNDAGIEEIILVDDFSRADKNRNFEGKKFREKVHRDELFKWLPSNKPAVSHVIHIGAKTDTALMDVKVFDRLNVAYTQKLWNWCADNGAALIYASSAATYGDGSRGFRDEHENIQHLKPLNPYGQSKQDLDLWALNQPASPPNWTGLKFFNVYGPNEYHKGRMASVIFHAYHQIQKSGKLRLFRSHKSDYKDGEQRRDFIYVKDVVRLIVSLIDHPLPDGIYNLGTGKARTFNDLAISLFQAMEMTPEIEYFDTPEDIRESYQYFTQADMSKLRNAGYAAIFYELEAGVTNYVKDYLRKGKYF